MSLVRTEFGKTLLLDQNPGFCAYQEFEHLLFCVGLHCSLYLLGITRDLLLRCYATRGNAAAATSAALGCELPQLLQNLRSFLRRPRSQC
jgi:hypothetical protein